MHPQVEAAVIAGSVSFCGVVASMLLARWTLASSRERLAADAHALRQNMFKEILGKRVQAYAALWHVVITYDLNWFLENKNADKAWSGEFLRELNACNATYGAFFSESVYERFVEYRSCLVGIDEAARQGRPITDDLVERLGTLSAGTARKPGLATAIKDDLGSYVAVDLQAGT